MLITFFNLFYNLFFSYDKEITNSSIVIQQGMKIRKYDIPKVWSFAVPEEIDYFLKDHTNDH